jgi:hypothetical protein
MKAILIVSNWLVSLTMPGTVDMDASPLWASAAAILWFASAGLLLNYANRRGWMNKLNRQLKDL